MSNEFDTNSDVISDTSSDGSSDTVSDNGGELADDTGVDLNANAAENTDSDVNTNVENTSEISGEDLNEPETGYPPNHGFEDGTQENITLQPGEEFDRYGNPMPDSRFAAPAGTPFEQRSLPDDKQDEILYGYEVQNPVDATSGIAAPAYGQPGGGKQYEFDEPIDTHLDYENNEGDIKMTGASFEVDNR